MFIRPAASAVVVAVIAHVVLAIVAPRFERLFVDVNLTLPLLTKVFLGVSRWYANAYGWAVVAPLIVGIPILIVLGLGPWRSRQRRRLGRVLAVLTIGALLTTAILALLLPMLTLMEGMSSTKGR